MIRLTSARRNAITCWLLLVVLLRAYVPVGFMPTADNPLLLEVCAMSLASQMPAHGMAHDMHMPDHGVASHDMAGPDMAAHDMTGHTMSAHHSSVHGHFEYCPFGSASAAGPISHIALFKSGSARSPPPAVFTASFRPVLRDARAHPARGPPILA